MDGETVIPAGSAISGHVTHAKESAKVKGRAELGFRFTTLTVGGVTYDIDTKPISYVAENTKKDDAVKIGVGAAAGVGDRRDRRRQARAPRLAPLLARAPAPAWCSPPTAKKFGLQKDASSRSRLQTR